MAEMALLADR